MSKELSHKLLELSCDPPAGCWEKIAAELPDLATGMQFPARLHNLEIPAPPFTWNHITEALDSNPEDADLASRLTGLEVEPPANSWKLIDASLSESAQVSITAKRRRLRVLGYAAAAMITGILAFAGYRLLENKNSTPANAAVNISPETINGPFTVPENPNTPEVALSNNLPVREVDDDVRNDAALEASKKTYARLDINHNKKSELATGFSFSHFMEEAEFNVHGDSGFEEAVSNEPENASRYIVLMTPDGHLVRMSKKLSDLVCCVSGEEVDPECRSQIQKWRKQLACTDASHPGNFMDILSLVGSLSED